MRSLLLVMLFMTCCARASAPTAQEKNLLHEDMDKLCKIYIKDIHHVIYDKLNHGASHQRMLAKLDEYSRGVNTDPNIKYLFNIIKVTLPDILVDIKSGLTMNESGNGFMIRCLNWEYAPINELITIPYHDMIKK